MKTASEIKQACDPDLYVNMLANDPAHIARAKAKAARVERARRRSAAKAKAKAKADASLGAAVGICTGTIGLCALALAALV